MYMGASLESESSQKDTAAVLGYIGHAGLTSKIYYAKDLVSQKLSKKITINLIS
jgi:hypothetical protein